MIVYVHEENYFLQNAIVHIKSLVDAKTASEIMELWEVKNLFSSLLNQM